MEEREFHPVAQAWFGEMGYLYINFLVQIRREISSATLPTIPTHYDLVCCLRTCEMLSFVRKQRFSPELFVLCSS